ncbi:MAG: hypothetical protein RL514_1611 [Verrucomicrobiota bacterium]|jgi:two-component system chemotaxis sensor kinase CheA
MDATSPNSAADPLQTLVGLVNSIALELNFAAAGTDTGLLPINSFVMQIEELALPPDLASAAKVGRKLVDQIFDTTGKFDDALITQLCEWTAWMEPAAEAGGRGVAPPTVLASLQELGSPVHVASALKPIPAPAAPQPSAAPAADAAAGFSLNLEADGELLREFANEAAEHLQNIENGVLVLEDNPTHADTLNSVFRAFHSFKGCAGFLNLTTIKVVAHELESLLEVARQGRLTITSELINLILNGGDMLRQFVTKLIAHLAPGGYLIVGHSESLLGVKHPLKPVQPAVYRKPQ